MQVYLYKKQNNRETFLYIFTKSHTLFKNKDNLRYIFIDKKPDTLPYTIFHEMIEIGIYIYPKSTLRYVTFYYTKIKTLRKKQDNVRYVYIYV